MPAPTLVPPPAPLYPVYPASVHGLANGNISNIINNNANNNANNNNLAVNSDSGRIGNALDNENHNNHIRSNNNHNNNNVINNNGNTVGIGESMQASFSNSIAPTDSLPDEARITNGIQFCLCFELFSVVFTRSFVQLCFI